MHPVSADLLADIDAVIDDERNLAVPAERQQRPRHGLGRGLVDQAIRLYPHLQTGNIAALQRAFERLRKGGDVRHAGRGDEV